MQGLRGLGAGGLTGVCLDRDAGGGPGRVAQLRGVLTPGFPRGFIPALTNDDASLLRTVLLILGESLFSVGTCGKGGLGCLGGDVRQEGDAQAVAELLHGSQAALLHEQRRRIDVVQDVVESIWLTEVQLEYSLCLVLLVGEQALEVFTAGSQDVFMSSELLVTHDQECVAQLPLEPLLVEGAEERDGVCWVDVVQQPLHARPYLKDR